MIVMIWFIFMVVLYVSVFPSGNLYSSLTWARAAGAAAIASSPTPTAATTPAPARRIFMILLSLRFGSQLRGNGGRDRSARPPDIRRHVARAGPGPVRESGIAGECLVHSPDQADLIPEPRTPIIRELALELHVGPHRQIEPALLILALGREGQVPLDLDPLARLDDAAGLAVEEDRRPRTS